MIIASNWNVFVLSAKCSNWCSAEDQEVEPTQTPHGYDHSLKELTMLIHDWCNWQFDLFAIRRIVTLDEKHWNICLLVWVVSGLIGGSYVDLSSFKVLSIKHWSNIETHVWIVAFPKDWCDWYFFWTFGLWVVLSEKLSNIYLLVWVISFFKNRPNVFFHLFLVPLNVELSDINNFRLIELCEKVRNFCLIRKSIVIIKHIQNLDCTCFWLSCTNHSTVIESENRQENQKHEVAKLTGKDRGQWHKFEFRHERLNKWLKDDQNWGYHHQSETKYCKNKCIFPCVSIVCTRIRFWVTDRLCDANVLISHQTCFPITLKEIKSKN